MDSINQRDYLLSNTLSNLARGGRAILSLYCSSSCLASWNSGLADKGETDEVITYYLLHSSPACQPVACLCAAVPLHGMVHTTSQSYLEIS